MEKYAKVKQLNWNRVKYKGRIHLMKKYVGLIGTIDKKGSRKDDICVDFSDGNFWWFRPADLTMADTKKELQGAKT